MHGPWIGEYFGDVMLVNGKIWPRLTVEPAVYRFRYSTAATPGSWICGSPRPTTGAAVPMVIIGTEGGLLPVNPVGLERPGDDPGRAV